MVIDDLVREVRALRHDLEEVRRYVGLPQGRHSAEFLRWADEQGLDPDDFEPMEVPPPGTHTMTVAEAAAALGIGEEQTRRLLRAGTLFGVPLGGRAGWCVSRSAVEELLHARQAGDRTQHASARQAGAHRMRRPLAGAAAASSRRQRPPAQKED
jgi:excisionase family DNA binding protein